MKKLFIICMFFILCSGFVSSQNFATDQGAMILGGTASFSSYGSEGSSGRSTSISLYPVFDYFIMQNLFLGGSLRFNFSSNSGTLQELNYSYDNTTIGIAPEVGYTFGGAKSSMFPFLKVGFYYQSSSTSGITKTTSNGTTIIIGGGLVFEITKHVGIVGLFSYNIMNENYDGRSTSSNMIGLSFGFYGLIYK